MNVRENNLRILNELEYGVEERNDYKIDLYSPKFLFISQFKSHDELAEWIKINIKQ